MFSVIKRAGLAVGLVVASASVAQAQIVNTGTGFGATDGFWSVTWALTGSAPSGTTYTTPSGSLANAAVITTIPSPPWQPNNAPFARWIGINSTGTQQTSVGPSVGDGVNRFTYTFSTVLNSAGSISGGIGWDNILLGYRINGGALNNSVFGSSPNFNNDGFCRDADGEFAGAFFPNCVRQFTLANTGWVKGDIFSVVITGDGQTDGLFITTPEPSTYLLVAGGLLAMFGVSRRRRQGSIA